MIKLIVFAVIIVATGIANAATVEYTISWEYGQPIDGIVFDGACLSDSVVVEQFETGSLSANGEFHADAGSEIVCRLRSRLGNSVSEYAYTVPVTVPDIVLQSPSNTDGIFLFITTIRD